MIAESRDLITAQIVDELFLVKDQLSVFNSRFDAVLETIKTKRKYFPPFRNRVIEI